MVERLGRGQFEMHVSPFPAATAARPGSAHVLPTTRYHTLSEWRRAAGPALDRQASPFDRFEWFERTARLAGTVRRPLVLEAGARDGAAWLPLDDRGGGRAVALTSWYTLAFRPIFACCPSLDAIAGLARAARAAGLSRLTLEPVPEWDFTADRLADGFRAAGWRVELTEKTGNWVEDVRRRSWEQYLAARPGRLRSTIRRKSRNDALTVNLHDRVTPALWADYTAVFSESWKGEEGSLPFLRDMAEAAGPALRLGFARVDGEAVATQLWTVERGTATIHKLAYREAARPLSAGTVLSAAMFERAIDGDRVRCLDYGTGDDAYKRDWMGERRRLMTLTLTDLSSPRGRLALARDAAARLVARMRAD